MSARSQHRWLAWLLPLIVLRAFVPAGFMLSFDGGRPELMVCSGTGPMAKVPPAATPAPQHEHHDHHAHHAHHDMGAMAAMDAAAPESHHQHDSSAASHQNSICPFALVYSTNVTLAGTAPASWSALNGTLVSFPSASQPRSIAVLIDRIRGPPLA